MSIEIAKRILDSHCGSRFYKTDLHIHTPGSNDWDENNLEPENKSDKIRPKQFIQAALDKKLDLIAITDHNSVEWCEKIILAAEGTRLTVLPGFELTANPGVHILCIFDQKKNIDELRDLLVRLGIDRKQFGDPEAFSSDAIEEPGYTIIKEIEKEGGIAIPAHIHQGSGIIGRIKGGSAAKEFLGKSGCGILETSIHSLHDLLKEFLRSNPNRFAIIDGSDAHQIDLIGSKPIWLKMDTSGLIGIKQIALEPLKRILYRDPEENKKVKILGMYANGGTLINQTISFNSDLNCLIGGRGAGKSVVIDYLRFVFDSMPVENDLRNHLTDRFADLIRSNTSVFALISDNENKLWLYERKLMFDKKVKGTKETTEIISEGPIIYHITFNPPQAIKINDNLPVHKFEFYGQGEVQSITDTIEPKRQLKLVDDFVKTSINPRKELYLKGEEEILEIEDMIVKKLSSKSILETDVLELPGIEDRINEIEKDLIANNLEDHQIWEDANQWLKEVYDNFIEQKDKLTKIEFTALEDKPITIPDPDISKEYLSLISTIKGATQLLINQRQELTSKTDANIIEINRGKNTWNEHYQTELNRFSEILRKQGVENLVALNSELAKLKSRKDNINKQKIPKINQLKQELKKLTTNREKRIKELNQILNDISEIRVQASQEMTRKLCNSVIVEIQKQKDTNEYYSFLDKCSPAGIRSKDEQLQKIIERISPQELVALIVNKNSVNICSKSGVTTGTAERIIEMDFANVLQLERTRCDDIACIYLVLEGKKKTLNDLSQGEKCTAILSVILLDEFSPLIIDQPEDELDHNFIMANVVDTLGKVKQKSNPLEVEFIPKNGRQFIIATHNQNIPVLGDAEMIIKMHKIPGEDRCELECGHGLEHPDTIKHILNLEGGAEAFERRRRKYAVQGN